MNKNMKGNSTASVLISIVILILVIFGIYYWAKNSKNPSTVEEPTSSEEEARTPGEPMVSSKDASFISQSTAVLNGDVSPNGVQTSYWYEYGLTESFGSFTSPQLIGGGYVTYSAPASVLSLKADTTYHYRLAAQNQFGKVYGNTESFKTASTASTPPVSYLPPTVQTKDAAVIKQNSATLNAVVNPRGAPTFYWFEYGKNFGLGNTTPTASLVSSNANTTVSSALLGLESDTTYYYRVNAQNAYGTVNGNISIFVTQPVNPPTPPIGTAPNAVTNTASSITSSSDTLNGEVNPNGSATTYYFEYGKSTLFGLFTLDQKTSETSAGNGTTLSKVSKSVTDLDNDSTFYYRLVSKSNFGTTYGAIYSFTTSRK